MGPTQRILTALSLFFLALTVLTAQETATVHGRITDAATEQPIEFVTVFVKDANTAVSTDEQGNYAIQVPAGRRVILGFRRVAYKDSNTDVLPLQPNARFALDVAMAPAESNLEVIIRDRRLDDAGMVRERNIEDLKLLPSSTGNLESVLPHIALGTNTGAGGELTSQYQVRGGNYDENLVYVNDFEIYRPQPFAPASRKALRFRISTWCATFRFPRVAFRRNTATKCRRCSM